MAIRIGKFLGFYPTLQKFRYTSIPFSSISSNNKQLDNSNLDEQIVLTQLSDLLSIKQNTLNSTSKQIESRVINEFLSPAEKLRGIFLQKLNGKAAIENALTLNLGGEAMVSFFKWAIKQPGITSDLRAYRVILKALGRRKYFGFMEDVLREMVRKEIRLDSETLFTVMDSFVRGRLVSKAVKLFENLEEFGLRRDTDSLNVLLECFCRRSHVGSACSFMYTMKGKIEFDLLTYNVIIGGWSKLGRVNEVEKFIKEMVDDGFAPDCLTFSYLVEGLGRAGRVKDAVGIFGKMSENGCPPDTVAYNAMISNFVSVGELDECMKCYRDMEANNISPDMNTYTIMISAFLKSRSVADALELFDEMLDRGILPNTGTITLFLEPLCSFGPPHAATMIYKKARKVGCEISLKAYKLLLMRLSRFGKCGMVLQIWEEMQSCGYSSDMEVYEYVVNGLCNIGQLENAALVMEEALRKGFCPGKLIYSKLNHKLLNANKAERAYRLFLKVKEARRHENARRFWRANGWHF
ncbi:hypothetical protein ACHQM5_024330 [Ranunculus cassubicifolius]